MGFWSDIWAEIRYGPGGKPMKPGEYRQLIFADDPDDDPDFEERCRLQDEKRRLQKRFDLLKLDEECSKLTEEVDKMARRREERKRRGER